METLREFSERVIGREKKEATLQQKFEDLGGEGDVLEFIQIGETDPHPRKEKHWETLTEEEQDLWVDITKVQTLLFAPVPAYFK